MKVIALNSSSHMGEGTTAWILNPFLEGMKEAGAEVELIYTTELKINPCHGEINCWLKTPGKCYQKDDMDMLLPKMAEADIWVLASPVYADGMSGTMKNILVRTIPLLEPFFEVRDGHCHHPRREGTKSGKIVLASSCGLWEMDNFDPILTNIKAMSKNVYREFAGALLRPHAQGTRWALQEGGMQIDDIFEAAKEAGRQLVLDGRMSPETLNVVSREVVSLEHSVQIANSFLKH